MRQKYISQNFPHFRSHIKKRDKSRKFMNESIPAMSKTWATMKITKEREEEVNLIHKHRRRRLVLIPGKRENCSGAAEKTLRSVSFIQLSSLAKKYHHIYYFVQKKKQQQNTKNSICTHTLEAAQPSRVWIAPHILRSHPKPNCVCRTHKSSVDERVLMALECDENIFLNK